MGTADARSWHEGLAVGANARRAGGLPPRATANQLLLRRVEPDVGQLAGAREARHLHVMQCVSTRNDRLQQLMRRGTAPAAAGVVPS